MEKQLEITKIICLKFEYMSL